MTALEGDVGARLKDVPDASLDVVMCISVLEHLWDPEQAVREMFRILAPGGTCLLNVPSWRGKWFLELSAFRLGLSPADEMDDHKFITTRRTSGRCSSARDSGQNHPLLRPQIRAEHVRRVSQSRFLI